MADEQETTPEEVETISYTVREFFELVPPNQYVAVTDMRQSEYPYPKSHYLSLPEIILYCDNDQCLGERLFKHTDSVFVSEDKESNAFVYYKCKNCSTTTKEYAISAFFDLKRTTGFMYKYGEFPQFGPPTPAKVVRILGDEREHYFKGRRSENQGLGIAAFAYYRRVVENQKNKIFDEIIRTVQKINPGDTALINELEAAKKENQFSKAVELIKHAIPQVLFIDGHNPLTLLHSALSEGLHEKTDEECLELATSVRIVLTELVERMSTALKDTAELKSAVGRIIKK